MRKINLLKAHCRANGWHLSTPEPIQDGLQFTIAPFEPPEFKINIYSTGAHSPKISSFSAFSEFLKDLASLDEPEVPIRSINETFSIKDPDLRKQIREGLDVIKPLQKRTEQYCEYSYRFVDGKENLTVKQYSSGKLLLQGSAGVLYKKLLEIIVPMYNLRNPKANLSIEKYLNYEVGKGSVVRKTSVIQHKIKVPYPHIGTDESGKGDYFGPMVIAGVWLDEPSKAKLEAMGIKDSKLLSDKRCSELATRIREICNGKFEEVEISPERYNELYDQFKKEGKNLNHLLAWGHARAIESLLTKISCSYAVADQFGDEKFILSKLMEKGRKIELIQTPKGERYIAVAAASILARDRFLSRMERLSNEYGVLLPRGASDLVIEPARIIVAQKGIAELKKLAKIHHKTTKKISETA